MAVDEPRLHDLIEQSQDIHGDAMRATTSILDEVIEVGRDVRARNHVDNDRRRFLTRSLSAAGTVTAGVFGAGFLRGAVTRVYAADADVDALQTSAAIENQAVAVYTKAASLPANVSGASNPVVLKFVQTTIMQHTDHASAFSAAIMQLGGKAHVAILNFVPGLYPVPASFIMTDRAASPADLG